MQIADSRNARSNQPLGEPDHERAIYLPTADEIADECRRIRHEWTRTEQHRRRAGATAADYQEH